MALFLHIRIGPLLDDEHEAVALTLNRIMRVLPVHWPIPVLTWLDTKDGSSQDELAGDD